MKRFCVSYPRYGIDIGRCYGYDYICLSTIFTYNKISCLISKNTNKKQLCRDVQVLCNIRNKDRILYSELLFAINKFNSGKCDYILSNSSTKKILRAVGSKHRGYFKVTIYADKLYCDTDDGGILLNLKSEQISIINIDY